MCLYCLMITLVSFMCYLVLRNFYEMFLLKVINKIVIGMSILQSNYCLILKNFLFLNFSFYSFFINYIKSTNSAKIIMK